MAMDIDISLLAKIKTNLRISHTVLDDDLTDSIAACVKDLRTCGVTVEHIDDVFEMDPLILNAIKLYCRKEYTDDTGKAAEYQKRYDSLKSCLMMASEYNGEATGDE